MNSPKILPFLLTRNALFVLALLVLAVVSGCRPREVPQAETPEAEQQPAAVAQPVRSASSAEAESTAQTEAAQPVLPSPFRVGSLVDRGGGRVRAGLISDESGRQAMVGEGDSFEGYEVVEIDSGANQVLLSRGGSMFIATMGPAKTKPAPTAALASPDPNVAPPVFEPTQDELNRGIDPNDPQTWPEGFRGPAIERAGREKKVYQPTDDERRRGIDPNDPQTWPEGYRGPAIERLMMQPAR